MTAVTRPRPHPRAVPRRDRTGPGERHGRGRLRVVDAREVRAAGSVRRAVAGISLLVALALVVAVAFHVTLAQGQLELDRLRAEAAEEQARYERVRVDVAAAAAPDEIVRRAQDLGMVEPDEVRYVSSLPGTTAVGSDEASETTAPTFGNWPTVKSHLAEQP